MKADDVDASSGYGHRLQAGQRRGGDTVTGATGRYARRG